MRKREREREKKYFISFFFKVLLNSRVNIFHIFVIIITHYSIIKEFEIGEKLSLINFNLLLFGIITILYIKMMMMLRKVNIFLRINVSKITQHNTNYCITSIISTDEQQQQFTLK